jgi:Domain of unknown function (DUF4157)
MFASKRDGATHRNSNGDQNSLKSVFFQPKRGARQFNNRHEVEADSVADRVIGMKAPLLSRHNPAAAESADTSSYTNSLSSAGSALSSSVREFFEPRFGYDFSRVRIHDDSFANESARQLHARAYTIGNNIVFNRNQFAPSSDDGKKLLAHELVHVMQHSSSKSAAIQKKEIPGPPAKEDTPCEKASLIHAAVIKPGENIEVKPCVWTMFKNSGACELLTYVRVTPTHRIYRNIMPGETVEIAAPKSCEAIEVYCGQDCEDECRVRWGKPCNV